MGLMNICQDGWGLCSRTRGQAKSDFNHESLVNSDNNLKRVIRRSADSQAGSWTGVGNTSAGARSCRRKAIVNNRSMRQAQSGSHSPERKENPHCA
jgi:hypothetical protein